MRLVALIENVGGYMERAGRLALYEKLYFLELDRREKISARLALPFGVILASSALLSFMLNAPQKPSDPYLQTIFWILFVASACALVAGAWIFSGSRGSVTRMSCCPRHLRSSSTNGS